MQNRTGDQRDARTWVVIELSPKGEEKVEDGSIVQQVRRDLRNEALDVFVPAVTYLKGRQPSTIYLIEGYVFVSSEMPETDYFALEQKPYVAQVMSTHTGRYGLRTLSVVTDAKIQDLRNQLQELLAQELSTGSWVRILEGRYKNLVGKVRDVEDDLAIIQIALRSLAILVAIPRAFLEPIDCPEEYAQLGAFDKGMQEIPDPPFFKETILSVLGLLDQSFVLGGASQAEVRHHVLLELGLDIFFLPYSWKIEDLFERVDDALALLHQEGFVDVVHNTYVLTDIGRKKSFLLNQLPDAESFQEAAIMAISTLSYGTSGRAYLFELVQIQTLNLLNIDQTRTPRCWDLPDLGARVLASLKRLAVGDDPFIFRQGSGWGLTASGALAARKIEKSGSVSPMVARLVPLQP